MATVSTIDNLRLDTNKKVFVVGKGGSSVNAINLDRSNGYTVCINSSCVLFEEVDCFTSRLSLTTHFQPSK